MIAAEAEIIDTSPEPEFLIAEAAKSHGDIFTACSELIDNSFGAGATLFAAEFTPGRIVFRDNGRGTKCPEDLTQLGRHSGESGTGTYGVGAKDALHWFYEGRPAFEVQVASRTIDGDVGGIIYRPQAIVELRRYHVARMHPEQARQLLANVASGTTIHITGSDRQPWRDSTLKPLLQRLSYAYAPGLTHSAQDRRRRIIVRAGGKGKAQCDHRVLDYPWPELEAADEFTGQWDGLPYSVRCGVIKDGQSQELCGYNVAYGYRILGNDTRGTGDYCPPAFFALVTLNEDDPRWKRLMHRNKDGLSRDARPFFDQLYRQCEAVIQEATAQVHHTEAHGLLTDVTDAINQEVLGRERRDRTGDSSGTVEPKGTGRKRETAEQVHENLGDVRGRRRSVRAKRITVVFSQMDNSRPGELKRNNGSLTILLNENNGRIEYAKRSNDRILLHTLAMIVLANGLAELEPDDRRPYLPVWAECAEANVFMRQLGEMLDRSPLNKELAIGRA